MQRQRQQTPKAPTRRGYPSDVSDEEWAFVAPYLTLIPEVAGQREHRLREVFNALRYMVRSGIPWRYLPGDLPPWAAVYQQTQRWIQGGVFEAMVQDLRTVLRLAAVDAKGGAGRGPHPSAVILDGTVLQSTPESGHRAGYSGAKRKKGSKLHLAVDTLGHLLTVSQPLQVVEADQGTGEVQEGAVHRHAPLVADRQAPVPGQPRQRPLHDPPVTAEPGGGLDPLPRDAVLDPALDAGVAAAAVVVALVGVELRGPAPRASAAPCADRDDRVEQRHEHAAVVDVRRRHRDGERDPLPVDEEVVLRARLALVGRVRADVRAPPFAGRLLLSRAARLQSIWSAAARRSSIT